MKNLFQIFFFIPMFCFAQETNLENTAMEKKPGKNTVYFELLGNAGLYSMNYERMIIAKNKWSLWGRAGYALWDFYWPDKLFSSRNIFPVELNCLYGKRGHRLESGLGCTFVFDILDTYFTGVDYYHSFYFRLGYRFQLTKGLMIRTAPLFLLSKNYQKDISPLNPINGRIQMGIISVGVLF